MNRNWKFEATCICGGHITGNGGHEWRHSKGQRKTTDRDHQASPTGTMRQI